MPATIGSDRDGEGTGAPGIVVPVPFRGSASRLSLQPSSPLSRGLVHSWPGGEDNGNPIIRSAIGRASDLHFDVAPVRSGGIWGTMVQSLPGPGESAVNTSPGGDRPRSVSLWIKTSDTTSGFRTILSAGTPGVGTMWSIGTFGDALAVDIGYGGFVGPPVADGLLHHVGVSYGPDPDGPGGIISAYIDGRPGGNVTIPSLGTIPSIRIRVGDEADPDHPPRPYGDAVENIKIWDRELSPLDFVRDRWMPFEPVAVDYVGTYAAIFAIASGPSVPPFPLLYRPRRFSPL